MRNSTPVAGHIWFVGAGVLLCVVFLSLYTRPELKSLDASSPDPIPSEHPIAAAPLPWSAIQTPSPTVAAQAAADSDTKTRIFRRAAALVDALRNSLRDPDSLVLEDVYYRADGTAVCGRYRSKNGFGGYNRAFVVSFSSGKVSQVAAKFNAACAGKGPFQELGTWGL